jgi:hypothetical protein
VLDQVGDVVGFSGQPDLESGADRAEDRPPQPTSSWKGSLSWRSHSWRPLAAAASMAGIGGSRAGRVSDVVGHHT